MGWWLAFWLRALGNTTTSDLILSPQAAPPSVSLQFVHSGLTEVSNHDYFIAHKAFFFDLSVWADEAPVHHATNPDANQYFCEIKLVSSLHIR